MSRDDESGVPAQGLAVIGHISYLMHAIVAVAAVVPGLQPSVALLIVAVILDLVKQSDAQGTWQASHFRWRIWSVLWVGVLYAVTSPLFLLLYIPGAIAWAIVSVWFLYRIVRGWMNLNAGRAMPD